MGVYLSAHKQPAELPGLRQRWKFLKPAMDQAKVLRLVPFLGSLGCPYKCSFCIDAVVPYQPLAYDGLKDDLRFFQELKLPRAVAVWHDPNFGIRFDEYLDAIEEVVPPGSVTFVAEISLSLLKEDNLKRLKRNGFKAIAPGIESWFDIGDKSRMRTVRGMEKVKAVAEQANLVNEYIPYTQCNLIFGLDADEGPEPFELTKRFIDLAPGVYPHFAVLSAFGRNAVLNLEYQRPDRVVPVPFHFLDLVQSMNVRPRNYSWPEFYDHVIDTLDYSFRPGPWVAAGQEPAVVHRAGAVLPRDLVGAQQPQRVPPQDAAVVDEPRFRRSSRGDARGAAGDDGPDPHAPGPALGVAARGCGAARSQGVPALRHRAPAPRARRRLSFSGGRTVAGLGVPPAGAGVGLRLRSEQTTFSTESSPGGNSPAGSRPSGPKSLTRARVASAGGPPPALRATPPPRGGGAFSRARSAQGGGEGAGGGGRLAVLPLLRDGSGPGDDASPEQHPPPPPPPPSLWVAPRGLTHAGRDFTSRGP